MSDSPVLRDSRKAKAYFDTFIAEIDDELRDEPNDPVNRLPDDRVRAARQLFEGALYVLIARYSRGDDLDSLRPALDEVLRRREQLAAYGEQLPPRQQVMRRSLESFDNRFRTFDTYLYHLGWWSLALCLGVDDDDRRRMISVTGNAGVDALFDHLAVALGDSERDISTTLAWPDLHAPLLEAVATPSWRRPALIQACLERWYPGCAKAAWHDNHLVEEGDEFELSDCYVGYWCFEAALVVALCGIDDSSFRDHPHYPADLVRYYRARHQSLT